MLAELQNSRLPKNAALVAAHLFKVEEAKANDIIKAIGVHRFLVYDALDYLVQHGLVKKISHERFATFRLVSVEPLLSDAERQYHAALEVSRLFHERAVKPESSVRFYQGVEGVHAFTEFVLEIKKPLYVLSGNAKFKQLFPEVFDTWNEQRQRRKIPFTILLPATVERAWIKNVPGITYKFLDVKLYPSVLWIFGEYVAHIVWHTKQATEIIMLHQPLLAEQQQAFFNALWRVSGKAFRQ